MMFIGPGHLPNTKSDKPLHLSLTPLVLNEMRKCERMKHLMLAGNLLKAANVKATNWKNNNTHSRSEVRRFDILY